MKYHIKNKISKRELRKHRKLILPLMKFNGPLGKAQYDDLRDWIVRRGDNENKTDCDNIPMPENDG